LLKESINLFILYANSILSLLCCASDGIFPRLIGIVNLKANLSVYNKVRT
jgi:hypothetical protein